MAPGINRTAAGTPQPTATPKPSPSPVSTWPPGFTPEDVDKRLERTRKDLDHSAKEYQRIANDAAHVAQQAKKTHDDFDQFRKDLFRQLSGNGPTPASSASPAPAPPPAMPTDNPRR